MTSVESRPRLNRAWIARFFTAVEDVVYVGLGLLLAVSSLVLLVTGAISFGQHVIEGSLAANISPTVQSPQETGGNVVCLGLKYLP